MNTENPKRDPLEWEEVSCEHVVQDEWIDFRRLAYRFPDGKIYEPYYTSSRRSYVVIVASDEEGKFLCVRQYRQGIRQVTTEFVAGGIERKDGREYAAVPDGQNTNAAAGAENEQDPQTEDPLAAAKRELREETGCESDEWTHLLTVPSNATIADNYAYIYAAKNCRRVTGQNLDAMEFLNVERYTAQEIDELIEKGKFQQAMHIMGWLLYNKYLESDRQDSGGR